MCELGFDIASPIGDAAIDLAQALIDIRRPILGRSGLGVSDTVDGGRPTVIRLEQMEPVIALQERLAWDEKQCRSTYLAAEEVLEAANLIVRLADIGVSEILNIPRPIVRVPDVIPEVM